MTFTTHSIGPDGLMREMNVNWQDVLESNKQKTNVLETDFAQDIMVKGLVTHTVLESHAVRCIIPLRLRPDSDYDVAFVSVSMVRRVLSSLMFMLFAYFCCVGAFFEDLRAVRTRL